ncbi:unnamed protein product [Lathyrus oleraceus]
MIICFMNKKANLHQVYSHALKLCHALKPCPIAKPSLHQLAYTHAFVKHTMHFIQTCIDDLSTRKTLSMLTKTSNKHDANQAMQGSFGQAYTHFSKMVPTNINMVT